MVVTGIQHTFVRSQATTRDIAARDTCGFLIPESQTQIQLTRDIAPLYTRLPFWYGRLVRQNGIVTVQNMVSCQMLCKERRIEVQGRAKNIDPLFVDVAYDQHEPIRLLP
jgi:hypothetical protein